MHVVVILSYRSYHKNDAENNNHTDKKNYTRYTPIVWHWFSSENFKIWKIMMMWKKDWFSLIWLFLSFAILLSVLVVCDLKHMSIKTNRPNTWMHDNACYCRIGFLHDILSFVNFHTAYTLSNSCTPITFTPIILLKTGVRFAIFSW